MTTQFNTRKIVITLLVKLRPGKVRWLTYEVSQVCILPSLRRSYNPYLQKLLQSIQCSKIPKPHYQHKVGILSRKSKIIVCSIVTLRHKLISHFYASSIGDHSCVYATLHILKLDLYWERMKQDMYSFIRECDT